MFNHIHNAHGKWHGLFTAVFTAQKCIAYLVISADTAQFQCKHSKLICLLQLRHSCLRAHM